MIGERAFGWKLASSDRAALLACFPRAMADHRRPRDEWKAAEPLVCPRRSTAVVIGRADDGAGVEAFVMEIAGASDRFDGRAFHINWSLAQGREAKQHNDVIARYGWQQAGGTSHRIDRG